MCLIPPFGPTLCVDVVLVTQEPVQTHNSRDEGEALEGVLRELRSAGDSNFSPGFLILPMTWKQRCSVAEVLGIFWNLLTFNAKSKLLLG